jgi:hypothetical protein
MLQRLCRRRIGRLAADIDMLDRYELPPFCMTQKKHAEG